MEKRELRKIRKIKKKKNEGKSGKLSVPWAVQKHMTKNVHNGCASTAMGMEEIGEIQLRPSGRLGRNRPCGGTCQTLSVFFVSNQWPMVRAGRTVTTGLNLHRVDPCQSSPVEIIGKGKGNS